jgi:hypothetical protein
MEPSLNRRSIPRVAKKLCELGATTEDLAEVFGTSVAEMDRWLGHQSDFSRACANGRIAALNKISNRLLRLATGLNVPTRRIVYFDGMAAQITVEESQSPDLEAANALLGEFRKRAEIKAYDALLPSAAEEAMAALRGTISDNRAKNSR